MQAVFSDAAQGEEQGAEDRRQGGDGGDGVNDAPALAAADVGIAMGVAGTQAALLRWIGPVQAAAIHLGPDILVFLNSVKLLRVRLDEARVV